MKSTQKLEGASKLGVKIRKDPSLKATSNKVLFPEKLEFANKVVSNLKWKQTSNTMKNDHIAG